MSPRNELLVITGGKLQRSRLLSKCQFLMCDCQLADVIACLKSESPFQAAVSKRCVHRYHLGLL